jgi:hypothetical protein
LITNPPNFRGTHGKIEHSSIVANKVNNITLPELCNHHSVYYCKYH